MSSSSFNLSFDAGWLCLPGCMLIGMTLAFTLWNLSRKKLTKAQIGLLILLRMLALGMVLFLACEPVTVLNQVESQAPYVSVLLDKSASMSLTETTSTRFSQATLFLKNKLAPALLNKNWKVHSWLFASTAQTATAEDISVADPNGVRTDVAGALLQAAEEGSYPPLAIILLTDGISNDSTKNTKALSALIDRQIPVYAVGFGSDEGPASLRILKATAPSIAAVKQEFHVTAQLSLTGDITLPAFSILLNRDGQLIQNKTVASFKGSRTWSESFNVTENEEGRHTYSLEISPPDDPKLVLGQRKDEVEVRISNDKDLRILYVQGTLTWDYKFISLALHNDPSLRITGLSQTSEHSVYRQNVEKAGELLEGFPSTMEQISPYRVVVISNLKPQNLNQNQQEILTRFCGELGGGVLLLGGAGTFDGSWQGSLLEKLLPVTFDPSPGVQIDKSFHLVLTDEALRHPVFKIGIDTENAEAWNSLTAFTQYGRVDRAKPGAIVWAVHDTDVGVNGKRILMAEQNYGAGRSAVICVQNFWRWRLGKESDPDKFDRFWRQLFRFLGDYGRQSILIDFTDQQLDPPAEINFTMERQANAADFSTPSPTATKETSYEVMVEGPDQKEIVKQEIALPVNQSVPMVFHAEKEGLYHISIRDTLKVIVSERSLELSNTRVEMERTGRDMDNLKQWSSLTQGKAYKLEECDDLSGLIESIEKQAEIASKSKHSRLPWGLKLWTLSLLLGSLSLEWILRKHWNLL